jgi:twitching motility protein PilT
MTIFDMLEMVVQQQGSDLHLIVGSQPTIRVNGQLSGIPNSPVLNAEQVVTLVTPLLTQDQTDYIDLHKELDFGYQYGDKGRFRIIDSE